MVDQTRTKSVAESLQASGSGTVEQALDKISGTSPVGTLSTAIGSSFFGINHRQTPNPIPINKDNYGLTFFTRPDMNMSSENLRAERDMVPLLTTDSASVPRILRCLLDRTLAGKGISSQFMDAQQAFIPMLTNHLLSISGWPDPSVETFTAPQGSQHESFSMVDDTAKIFRTYDITANFRNIPGDPITSLFYTWIKYASYVYLGTLIPYPDKIIDNEIDYMTRIYRISLNANRTHVSKIGACGAAFPLSAPLGAAFNFESDRPFNNSNDQVSITFRAMGAMYQDDILIKEFNDTVGMFNDTMKDRSRSGMYKKVPQDLLGVFNNQGYPRIDPDTYEMQWWVSNETWASIMGAVDINRNNTRSGNTEFSSARITPKI